jgi:integrator complex subunit 4
MSALHNSLAFVHLQRQSGKMIPVAEGDFDVESEEFRILDSGACGAFVHGLEDEYKEVRNASIGMMLMTTMSTLKIIQYTNTCSDSICELCMYSDQFTTKAVDFLVDMFNDEIDQVRINAIQSLRKIGTRTRLVFDGDQLEIVIGALEDADKAAREGTHDLLRYE